MEVLDAPENYFSQLNLAQPFETDLVQASADAGDCSHQRNASRQNLISQDSALSAVDKFGNSLRKMTRGMPTTSRPQCNLSPLLDRPVIRTHEDPKDTRSRFQCDEDRRVCFTPAVPTTGAMPSAFESVLPAREKRFGVHTNFQPEFNASPFLHAGGLQDARDGLPASSMSRQGWISSSQNVRCLPSGIGQFKAVEVGDRFLPKPSVERFEGDPIDYWAFVNRFEVHVASRITDDDLRLAYVLQHCAKPVYEKLKHIASDKNKSRAYRKVGQELYERYGQPHVISRCCERCLTLSLPRSSIDYLTELRRATCSVESHSSFCSPFSPAEFLAAASNLSSSTATGPDKVAYPMLKHLPRSGMDFLLHIFNLSWSSHSFPSIWKTSSIIPIHKMGKPLDSPASIRPISLTSCVSKLFERIILSRLLFFLESNSILSPRQAGFCPGRSTLDQILYLSQSISDGFNKPRPGSRTILSTIDFSKAFDSVWHPALFHKLVSAGLPPCFARWTQSFLSDRRACVVFQNHKSRSFRVRRGVPQGSVLGPVLFSLFINDLPDSLPSSVSCSLYADDLAIWSSSPSVPTAVEATQGALFRLERWSEYWCLPLNPSKCEASFFSVDPHQANL